MHYQLSNGKVIYLTVEQYLDLSDEDIQYLIAHDFGEHAPNPFTDSVVISGKEEKHYDFDYLPDDETENDVISDDDPFDDIVDISDSLDY